MKSKKIGIIGHFGANQNILDGQTIKTKILYDELKNISDLQILKVDTYYKKERPLKLLIDTFVCLFKTRNIIILLSGNGMRFYFPLLYVFSKIFGTRVFHDVIGGNLDKYVKMNPKFKKYLNQFVVNWVETDGLKNKLESCDIMNCEVIPNFKKLNIISNCELPAYPPYGFCIFSRVMQEKGIETAIEAINAVNKDSGKEICQLDIFGRIDEGYQDRFEKVLQKHPAGVKYKGTVHYDRSVEAIKGYYALLFPTYWEGEGFPGTIVDAFSAGLPVVATDWNCNSEIVENKVNGILYPNGEIADLKQAIQWLITHNAEVAHMKKSCIETAKKYQPEYYIKKIISRIFDMENGICH